MNPDVNLGDLLDLVQLAVRAKDNWVSRCSKKHLPPAIVRRAESKNKMDVAKSVEYAKRNGYHEEAWPNGWYYFKKGDFYLGAFRWIIDGTKIARYPVYALGL